MSVTVKYNHDLAFRRRVAFRRMYRARNFQKRFALEMIALACSALSALIIWMTGSEARFLVYVFFFAVALAIYLLVRLLRAAVIAARVKDGGAALSGRTFVFDESGFSFGPINAAGKRIETRWRDVNRAYLTEEVLYLLAMGRQHWAAVDRRLVVEGTWEELVVFIRENLPKRQIID